MTTEIEESDHKVEIVRRLWGGWLALSKDRPLGASGATASEARARLESAISRFDEWAERWERDHAAN
jgi:hypothetical protein